MAYTLPGAAAAESFVRVDDVNLQRADGKAVVTARVTWNASGVTEHGMNIGDLRLVAVSEQGHLPFVLDTSTRVVTGGLSRDVTITIDDERAIAAMRDGNRIVLTASQHAQAGQVTRSDRTYVTVAEVQPYGSPQPNIGTKDCSDVAVVPGAMLRYCDLVGANFDGALVSNHDPKSSEGKRPSQSTRMERADLTGATAVRSDFSGASVAGGRMNGVDLRRAKLDNLSLAGAEAIELNARGATSDKDAEDSGANLFRANLAGADLRDTIFRGISVGRARLDGTQLQGAVWESIADGATFRGADLTGTSLGASVLNYADLSDATLTGSTLTDLQLAWTWLCRTKTPAGSVLDGSRDCRTPVEQARVPLPNPDRATPYVTITSDSVSDGPGPRTVKARINWNADSAKSSGWGMTIGDLRLIAVDSSTGVATVLDTQSYSDMAANPNYEVTIDNPGKLEAMARGNRIVLTATQHAPKPRGGNVTTRSYVTVNVLQRGPGLGQIGRLDCSRFALVADSPLGLDYCDLSGAMLDYAALNASFLRKADLSGATMQDGVLRAMALDGARLGSFNASGANWANVSAFDAWAPKLDLSSSTVVGSPLYARNLDGATFNRSTLSDSPLVAASLRRATFTNARLIHPDLAYTDLFNARLDGVNAMLSNPSLFLANLASADMTGSTWNVDESGLNPWLWATLCKTDLPSASFQISGDRDCAR